MGSSRPGMVNGQAVRFFQKLFLDLDGGCFLAHPREFVAVVYFFEGSEVAERAARRTHRVAWTIQAGVYQKKALADSEAKRVNSKSLPAAVAAVLHGGRPVFVLQLGRYATYAQAAASLAETKKLPRGSFVAVTR